MKQIVAAVWLVLSQVPVVEAGELHRCVGPSREVAYQSSACPEGHRTERTIAFDAEPIPVSVAARREATSPRYLGRPAATRINKRSAARPSRGDPCTQAKVKRDQAISRLGLKRTYDQLSMLDATVRAVCAGY